MERQRETGEKANGIGQRGYGVLKLLFIIPLVTPSGCLTALADLPVDRFSERPLDPGFRGKSQNIIPNCSIL